MADHSKPARPYAVTMETALQRRPQLEPATSRVTVVLPRRLPRRAQRTKERLLAHPKSLFFRILLTYT